MIDAQQIYAQAVRQLPVQERLRLAALILGELADASATAPPLDERLRKTALEQLMSHAGAVSSGNARSADNESIDADLAREYGKDI